MGHVVYSNVPAMPLRHYLTKGLQGVQQVQGVQAVQQVQTPLTYAMTPKVQYQTPAHTYAINPFYNFYQPQVYTHGYPMVHHMGKREAEAKPEAGAEADAQFYYNFAYGNYQQYPQSFYSTYNNVAAYTPYTNGYPYTTGYTGYPYTAGVTGYPRTTGYTYSPNTNKVYNVPAMPLRHYLTKGLQGVQGVQKVQTPVTRVFKREAEAEAEPEADAQQFYTNYYGNYQQYPQSFYSAYNRYPTTYNKAAYTPYTTGYWYNPYTTGYTGYPYIPQELVGKMYV